jgi:hypothetical protein
MIWRRTKFFDLLRVSEPKHEKPKVFEVENRTKSSSRQEDDPPANLSLQISLMYF